MFYKSICRLMFYALVLIQCSGDMFASSNQLGKESSYSIGQQAAQATAPSSNNEPRLTSDQSKKDEFAAASAWSNPFLVVGGLVAFIYAGGAVVAAAIWYRIKDLFPEDEDNRKKNDDEYD